MKKYAVMRLLSLFLCISTMFSVHICAETDKVKELIPGGVPFGVKMYSEGVSVVNICDVMCGGKAFSPAKGAGIMVGDIITAVNGKSVIGADQVSELLNASGGTTVELSVKRGGEEKLYSITPVKSDEDSRYKTGLVICDGTSGIGTVTYIDPACGGFAGLGHGICNIETGEPVPLSRGAVVNVEINGIIKGYPGTPGELKGYFSSGKIGTLFKNTECGVYGIFSDFPEGTDTKTVLTAASSEITEGEAELLCTLDNGGVKPYKVRLSDIDCEGAATKNFVVTIIDPILLEKTGGIVQGMSGSPIIQNGKLIGAVTHVFVNDPTRGYGIFIENMLSEAEN